MKQLEMKLTLDNKELDTFMEIALAIQTHLRNIDEALNEDKEEDEDQ